MKFVISLAVLALAASVTAKPGLFADDGYTGLAAVQTSIGDMNAAAADLGVIEGNLATLSAASSTVAAGETAAQAGVSNAVLNHVSAHT